VATSGKQLWRLISVRKSAGLALWLIIAFVLIVVWVQFRGGFTPETPLTLLTSRSGLVMDPGSKVTYNGVAIGRVASITEVEHDGRPAAKLRLNITPKYMGLIPANVDAAITATTVFGNKYVSLTLPKHPVSQGLTPADAIEAKSVSTEFNTLFETVMQISEKLDPVKVNLTLSAVADALNGLGDKFGASIVNGNAVLDDINPQMPQIRHDIQRFADLIDIYADASPDLWNALNNAVNTAHTFNQQHKDVDAALLAAVGVGNTAADVVGRGKSDLVRAVSDLVPTSHLLDTYSPEFYCLFHHGAAVLPKVTHRESGNGYSTKLTGTILGGENAYVYPDNLPRVNAHGGPGGKPGCWATITRDLWPAPYLVTDSGASIAPYNHFGLGQPQAVEYVWGRQWGEGTINP
jgi:phospholipid/cholesterol/gamma-HCH transport system substrate-binding protein